MQKTTRIVTFSSGAGSWASGRWVADHHGTDDLYLVFSDVKGDNDAEHTGEDEDNYRFLLEAHADIGGRLVWLREGRHIWEVFRDDRFIGNTRLANCSKFLKQEPFRRWLEKFDPLHTVIYVGIDWSETHRLPSIYAGYAHTMAGCASPKQCRGLWNEDGRLAGPGCKNLLEIPYQVEAPLTQPPYRDKPQILQSLLDRDIKPPRLYDMGFSHANCGGFCVRAGQGQFKQLLTLMPARYAYHEAEEQKTREYLGKDVAILRDRRGGKLRPMTMREFRERIESEQTSSLELDDFGGCGCFLDDVVAEA